MDKSKVISISKRLSTSNLSSSSPNEVYLFLSKNKVIPFFEILSAEDIALITFMIPMVNSTKDLESLYENIKSKMFSFTICKILDTEPSITCNYCGGEGVIDCNTCDGRSEADCDYCGGTGEQDDGEPCDECQGDGEIACSDCDQTGQVTCDYCDGSGEFVDENNYEVSVTEFLSWDENIFNKLEIIEDMVKIDDILFEEIEVSPKTFSMYNEYKSSDVFYSKAENDDVYFITLNKDLGLTKRFRDKIVDSNLDSI